MRGIPLCERRAVCGGYAARPEFASSFWALRRHSTAPPWQQLVPREPRPKRRDPGGHATRAQNTHPRSGLRSRGRRAPLNPWEKRGASGIGPNSAPLPKRSVGLEGSAPLMPQLRPSAARPRRPRGGGGRRFGRGREQRAGAPLAGMAAEEMCTARCVAGQVGDPVRPPPPPRL